jgi:hypothetical protein
MLMECCRTMKRWPFTAPRTYRFLLWILIFAGEAQAQTYSKDSTIWYIGSQAYYGFIIAHSGSIESLVKGTNPWGGGVEVSRLRYTQSAWNSCNCYSQNGIALTYFNFDSRNVLGSSVNLVLFAEPQLSLKQFNISLRAGLGVSYLTKVYHPESNVENVLFGSPLSGILLIQLNNRIWLSENLAVRVSAGYHHISNGGIKQPNLGMNFPTVSVGADYALLPATLVSRKKSKAFKNEIQYYAGLFFTTRKVPPEDSTRKPLLGFSAGFFKPFARMHALGLAAEFVSDWSLKEWNKQSAENYDHRVVTGLIRHHFLFGKFDFSQAVGFYLYKKYPTYKSIYQRYVLQYQITKRIQLGFSLKAHLHVAEQMDVRINYLF